MPRLKPIAQGLAIGLLASVAVGAITFFVVRAREPAPEDAADRARVLAMAIAEAMNTSAASALLTFPVFAVLMVRRARRGRP